MKLKSFLNKIVPGKKSSSLPPPPPSSLPEDEEIPIQYEMPLDKLDTRIETVGTVGEIDVFVNDEKVNIHTLSEETRIGRDPSQADIIISELIVSKLHCTIYARDDDYFIKDNNSTNGTYIHDEKISTDLQLENGNVIYLGKKGTVKLIFHKR